MKTRHYIYARLATILLSTTSIAAVGLTEDTHGIEEMKEAVSASASVVQEAAADIQALKAANGAVTQEQVQEYKDLEQSYIGNVAAANTLAAEGKDIAELAAAIKGTETRLLENAADVQAELMDEATTELLKTTHKTKKVSKTHEFIKNTSKKIKNAFASSKEEINVLTLDGGGIRGIGTLTMLSVLEMKTGKKTHEMFDRIYGTSTGGLAALMLARGKSATEVLEIYFKNANRIFTRTWWDAVANPFGLAGATYQAEGLEDLIKELVGEATSLSQVLIPVAVTTVDSKTGKIKLLSSEDEATKDVTMLEAGRATSAAPTYFPAKKVKTKDGEFMAIDGGVAVNNPAQVGYNHAKDIYSDQGKKVKINLFSLGTGAEALLQLNENAGKLGFGSPGNIPGLFMGFKAVEVEDNMEKLHKKGKVNQYGRYQFDLPFAIDLADISEVSKQKLTELAWARSNQEDFTSFVKFMREQNQKRKSVRQ